MPEEIPEGVVKVAELFGGDVTAEMLWDGLKKSVNTPENIAKFNQAITETVERFDGQIPKREIAVKAMAMAGAVILGDDRPAAPPRGSDFPMSMVAAGILKRVK